MAHRLRQDGAAPVRGLHRTRGRVGGRQPRGRIHHRARQPHQALHRPGQQPQQEQQQQQHQQQRQAVLDGRVVAVFLRQPVFLLLIVAYV